MGEAVAFINADMVPSREVFAAAERRFSEGKRLIICSSLRTLIAPAKHLIDGASFSRTEPPIGEHLATSSNGYGRIAIIGSLIAFLAKARREYRHSFCFATTTVWCCTGFICIHSPYS